jgi:ketosteroid isomerase-like protein
MLQVAHSTDITRVVYLNLIVLVVTHIMYADDLVLFSQVVEAEIDGLVNIMDIFGEISGMRINNDMLSNFHKALQEGRDIR